MTQWAPTSSQSGCRSRSAKKCSRARPEAAGAALTESLFINAAGSWTSTAPGPSTNSSLFETPTDWRHGEVVLRFSAVDYAADVWVNGAHAGRHEGGYTPLELDVGGSIHWGGTNVVTVRVFDPPDVADLPHGKQGRALECPELGGAIARATRYPPELCE